MVSAVVLAQALVDPLLIRNPKQGLPEVSESKGLTSQIPLLWKSHPRVCCRDGTLGVSRVLTLGTGPGPWHPAQEDDHLLGSL